MLPFSFFFHSRISRKVSTFTTPPHTRATHCTPQPQPQPQPRPQPRPQSPINEPVPLSWRELILYTSPELQVSSLLVKYNTTTNLVTPRTGTCVRVISQNYDTVPGTSRETYFPWVDNLLLD